jgi:predicted DCC family thiol-disulfide oxidoreductase YuxK
VAWVGGFDHVFIFDGDCAFCSTTAAFLCRHVRPRAELIPYQSADLESLGLTEAECAAAVRFADAPGRSSAGPEAIASLLRTSPVRPWRLAGRLLAIRPMLWLAWPVYRWISRNRHRMPGGSPVCAVPSRPSRDHLA